MIKTQLLSLVPTSSPTNLMVRAISFYTLTLSWQDIPYLSTHGTMRNFTVWCNGTLANQTVHNTNTIIEYVATTIDSVVVSQQHSYNMSYLFPHTVYNCSVDGCTTIGCGPETGEKNDKTFENCKLTLKSSLSLSSSHLH